MSAQDNLNPAQFYHGTAHTFRKGQILTGEGANKQGRFEAGTPSAAGVYFADNIQTAHGYAQRAARQTDSPRANVYKVEPVGGYHKDLYDAAGYHTNEGLRVVGRIRMKPGYPPKLV